ncbi:hypothetical protein CXB51_027773 [Gossypium anomalum]|uniref:NAC domain-containing protein n=1 Tax=Gossypium anomalum TaxID=47600 RepID=A0A8J6CMI5_9ROSI|nr:hypothetical protein CXB51_027773 [Gossypium anomalum]
MGLRDIGATLPPGFRFYPSDEELVCHYLYKKIANEQVLKGTLVEIDLHTCEPWQLPEVAKLNANEWYFFSFRDRKYATGFRTNRATTSGYWKATGKDRMVLDPTTEEVVGMRKTLVFYRNRAPNGIKTGWIMHEFRLHTPHLPPKSVSQEQRREQHQTQLPNDVGDLINSSCPRNSLPTYQLFVHHHTYLSKPRPCLLNLLQYNSHQENNSNEVSSKVDDGYEFLWDMEENSLGCSWGGFQLGGHEI